MRDRYHRMQAACLAMARQSNLPDERARWLALSQECRERAAELDRQSKSDRALELGAVARALLEQSQTLHERHRDWLRRQARRAQLV
jgi:hypothetical protein